MNTEPNVQRLVTKVIVDVACLLTGHDIQVRICKRARAVAVQYTFLVGILFLVYYIFHISLYCYTKRMTKKERKVGVPIYIFYLGGKPYERGFFCDDESLRHPYLDSTVPSWALYVVGLGLPICLILAIEYVTYAYVSDVKVKYKLLSARIPSWLYESYRHIGVFGFGAACSQLITDVAKYTVGRLRPHFFDVCKPKIDCTDPKYRFVYIEKFTCAQQSEKLLKDMRLSFPSGHSSFSAYCMLFLVMYLQAKMTWKGSKLLKHVVQYLCIMMAFYTALSRISDYKHHWSDVLAGSLQGVVVAVLIVVYVSDILQKPGPFVAVDSSAADGMRMENDMSMR